MVFQFVACELQKWRRWKFLKIVVWSRALWNLLITLGTGFFGNISDTLSPALRAKIAVIPVSSSVYAATKPALPEPVLLISDIALPGDKCIDDAVSLKKYVKEVVDQLGIYKSVFHWLRLCPLD